MNGESISHFPHISDEQIERLSELALADLFSDISNASGELMHLLEESTAYKSEFQNYFTLYIRLKDRIITILKREPDYADIDLLLNKKK